MSAVGETNKAAFVYRMLGLSPSAESDMQTAVDSFTKSTIC